MKHNRIQTYFFIALFAIVGVLLFYITKPYAASVGLAAIFAVVFYPLFLRVRRVVKNESLTALFVVGIVFLCILVPLSVLGILLVRELQTISVSSTIITFITPLQEKLHSVLPVAVFPEFNISGVLMGAIGIVTSNFGGIFAGAAHFFVNLFVAIVAFFYFLKDGDRFAKALVAFSPLDDKHDNMVLDKVRHTVAGVVQGSLLIALIQGVLTGLGLAFVGISNPVLWGSVATVGALIPALGTAVVAVPTVGYLLLIGNTSGAIGLALWGLVVVGLIDNIIRPKLVGRGSNMHPLFILIAVLGGLSLFGAVGLIFGPIILSLVVVLGQIYLELSHQWEEHSMS